MVKVIGPFEICESQEKRKQLKEKNSHLYIQRKHLWYEHILKLIQNYNFGTCEGPALGMHTVNSLRLFNLICPKENSLSFANRVCICKGYMQWYWANFMDKRTTSNICLLFNTCLKHIFLNLIQFGSTLTNTEYYL